MANVICIGGRKTSQATGITSGVVVGDSAAQDGTTSNSESFSQVAVRTPGTYNNLRCLVTVNGQSTSNTIQSRKNSSNALLNIPIGVGNLGEVFDITHSDHVVAGDVYNLNYGAPSGTGSITITVFNIGFTADHGTCKKLLTNAYAAGLTKLTYVPAAGSNAANSGQSGTEAAAQVYAEVAGTMQNLTWMIGTNGAASTTTITCQNRINSGNGNITASHTGSGLGVVEDAFSVSGHSDIVNVGDLINYKVSSNQVSGATASFEGTGVDFITTNGKWMLINSYIDGAAGSGAATAQIPINTTTYLPVGGASWSQYTQPSETEAHTQITVNSGFTASNLGVFIDSPNNLGGAGGSLTLRQNNGDTVLAVPIGTGTGIIRSGSNSITITSTDQIAHKIVTANAGSGTLLLGAIWMIGASTLDPFDPYFGFPMWTSEPTYETIKEGYQVVAY